MHNSVLGPVPAGATLTGASRLVGMTTRALQLRSTKLHATASTSPALDFEPGGCVSGHQDWLADRRP